MRQRMQVAKRTLPAAVVAALFVAVGCSPSGSAGGGAANVQGPSASGEQGYVAPPELTGATRLSGGRLELAGRASPGARVRLATPKGAALFVPAGPHGVWRFAMPALAAPQLLGLSMSDQGSVIQAQGYIFLAPDGVAARLRAGGGSQLAGPPPRALAAATLDYDTVLAATLSGQAGAGQAVTLRVDGVERGRSSADREGRFVLSLNQPLTAGPHDFELLAGAAETQAAATVTAPEPLAGAPFRASRTPTGWRIDWLTAGGGEQTTLLIDPSPPAR
jgi:hypothetical protein